MTKHEVVTLGKLGEERAQALGRAPVAAMSGFQIAVVHDCPERVNLGRKNRLARATKKNQPLVQHVPTYGAKQHAKEDGVQY